MENHVHGHNVCTCSCPHHSVTGLMVVLIGVAFLLGALDVLAMSTVNIIWPILLIIAGGTKLFEKSCTCC